MRAKASVLAADKRDSDLFHLVAGPDGAGGLLEVVGLGGDLGGAAP